MKGITNQFTSIEQVTDRYLGSQDAKKQSGTSNVSFAEVLKQKQGVSQSPELKISKHAAMRMENRKIELSDDQSRRLESGVEKAGEKGIQESLVMVDSLAFIVNIPNKTVVTAMDQAESENNIFTNIDGAVIV